MLMGSIQARELFEAVDGNINPIDEQFKMISFNQLEDPRHNPIINNNKVIINNIEYFYSKNNIHIAYSLLPQIAIHIKGNHPIVRINSAIICNFFIFYFF
jgi:hypothetical protein